MIITTNSILQQKFEDERRMLLSSTETVNENTFRNDRNAHWWINLAAKLLKSFM